MTGPANQQYQFAPSKPVNKMNSETQGNGNTTEPFYPTIPPPPEAAPQPSNHLYQPHPDFSNLQPPNFNSDSMLQVNNPNLGYPTSSPSDHQPFRPVPQEEAQNDSGPSGSRVWKSGDSHRFAPTSGEEGSNSDPSTSHAQPSGSSSQQNADSLPIARAQQKGSTYIPRVDRQHIGEAEHEQYKSKYAAEVRGLRSRIDDLWGGSAWFTQQIVPGYGRAGSHDRVLYTIQQLARGSPGEGGEGGTYPERVRQAIEDAVHARLAEENKNRKSKRENLNLRAVVTTNDFKAAAKALGCVSLRMPAGQPRKPRQPRQGNKAAAASTSKTPAANKNSNKGSNNNSASPSQSQSSSAEGSNWMQPVALTDPSVNHNNHHQQQQQLPIDYASQTSQIPPPSLPSNDDEVRANRAAFFAKYEADNRSRKTPNFMSDGGGLQPQGQGGSSPSYHSASSSRQLFTTLNTPQFGNYGQTNSWMNGSRDSNERWSGNQLSNSNTPQFGQNPSDRDQVYHSVPLTRRPSMEMDGSQLGREAYQQQHLSNGGGMRPSSPSMYANSINGMVSNSNQNGSHLMRSIPSPSMSHPPTSLASHSLSQMSSPQMRNMNPGESSSNLNSGGRALPPLPSLSLPPLNWNPSPQQHHQQHHHQRKRGSEEEILHDDSRDPKRRMANQFQPASAPADSLHYA